MAKSRNHTFLTGSKARLYEGIGLVVLILLLTGLAFVNQRTFCAGNEVAEASPRYSTQIYDLEAASLEAGFAMQTDRLTCPDGTDWTFAGSYDENGLTELTLSVPLYADETGESETAALLNRQNEAVRAMLLTLLERWYPLFGGSFADAERIVQGCESALKSGKAKTFSTKYYTLQAYPTEDGLSVRVRRLDGTFSK